MADVLEKSTFRLLKSVNTPDYPETDYIINPDLSKVASTPQKYWTIEEGEIKPMSAEAQVLKDIEILGEKEPTETRCPYGFTDKCDYINNVL